MNEATQKKVPEKKDAVRNRRLTQRRQARRSIRVECRKGSMGLGKDVAEMILDVSEDGIRLMLKDELPLGQEVEIIIHPEASRQSIKRLATVVWVVPAENKRYCAGFRFEKRIPYADVGRLGRP